MLNSVDLLHGNVISKRNEGCPGQIWPNSMRQWAGIARKYIRNKTLYRVKWMMVVANEASKGEHHAPKSATYSNVPET